MLVQNRGKILEAIGNTPLIRMEDTLVKCEFLNPSGSVKDRYAKYAVERAEREGLLKSGDTIVEATSGNMGNALAMVAAAKGYKMLVIMPKGFSHERLLISQAYGAQVRLVEEFRVDIAVELAKEFGGREGYYCPRQFENPWNIEENNTWLGQEILSQLPKDVTIDAFVQGVGTGGTLIGVGQALRERHNPKIKLFAMEPTESPTILTGRSAAHQIEGISDGFVPALFEMGRKDIQDVITVSSVDAIKAMRSLAQEQGFFVGPSSGANWVAVQEIRSRYPSLKTILTLFCDEGEKYLTEYFR
ncbi:MAG: cysteine synthase family protein [Chlamydiales bacterium]|nr:cysteine synthase family protein [Chlamydiales bacterium]